MGSVTVLTFLSSGSLLTKFLELNAIEYKTVGVPGALREFKQRAQELLSIEAIPVLEKVSYSYSKQSAYKVSSKEAKTTATALKNLKQRRLADVDPSKILLTCSKGAWYNKEAQIGYRRTQNQGHSQKTVACSARSIGSQIQLEVATSIITAHT